MTCSIFNRVRPYGYVNDDISLILPADLLNSPRYVTGEGLSPEAVRRSALLTSHTDIEWENVLPTVLPFLELAQQTRVAEI